VTTLIVHTAPEGGAEIKGSNTPEIKKKKKKKKRNNNKFLKRNKKLIIIRIIFFFFNIVSIIHEIKFIHGLKVRDEIV